MNYYYGYGPGSEDAPRGKNCRCACDADVRYECLCTRCEGRRGDHLMAHPHASAGHIPHCDGFVGETEVPDVITINRNGRALQRKRIRP